LLVLLCFERLRTHPLFHCISSGFRFDYSYCASLLEVKEGISAIETQRREAEEQLVVEREAMGRMQLAATEAQDAVFVIRKDVDRHQEAIETANRVKPQRAAEMQHIGEQMAATEMEHDQLFRSTNALRKSIAEVGGQI